MMPILQEAMAMATVMVMLTVMATATEMKPIKNHGGNACLRNRCGKYVQVFKKNFLQLNEHWFENG